MYDWVKSDLRNFGQYYSENSEVRDLSNKDIDIAFIGSGLSSTFTLIEYINQHAAAEWMTFDEIANDFRARFPFQSKTRPEVI